MKIFDEVVSSFEDSDVLRYAKLYHAEFTKEPWDSLDSFGKFTWLSFAERRMSRDN